MGAQAAFKPDRFLLVARVPTPTIPAVPEEVAREAASAWNLDLLNLDVAGVPMNLTSIRLLSILFALSITALALALIVALVYSYSTTSVIEAGVGCVILLSIAGGLWLYRRRSSQRRNSPAIQSAILVGIALGVLWMVEISINNFIAPLPPTRDIIDNLFWAIIALSILIFAIIHAYQTESLARGMEAGVWSGFVSGLLACCMALSVIVFGMGFLTRDPLNVAEWAERGTNTLAPAMAAYFAFETFAGAFGHLIVLGIVMGALLGAMGGILGTGSKKASLWVRRSRPMH